MSEQRDGDWMMVASGRQFWPLDPRADEVEIGDIANALANSGRYNGHTRHFYSVAQHSVELARWFLAKGDRPLARWALLHDAAEAYSGDIIRPIKPFLTEFAPIEARLERVVWQRFGLIGAGLEGELPLAVRQADRQITTDEMLALFPREALDRTGISGRARLMLDIRALLPTIARDRFMAAFRELFP